MKKSIFTFTFIFILFTGSAQDFFDHHKANFVYEFARLLNWSQYYEGEVVVNVLGETPVFDYLNDLSDENMVSGRKLSINKTTTANETDCNILFLTKKNTYLLPDIVANSIGKSTLIVTEAPNMTNSGADVSFVKKYSSTGDLFLSYIYNLNSIHVKNIKIASEFIGYSFYGVAAQTATTDTIVENGGNN